MSVYNSAVSVEDADGLRKDAPPHPLYRQW